MRVLMVGGGACGLALAQELVQDGNAVRVVSREGRRREAIEAVGAECWAGTPDRIGSLRYALDNVTALLWLLGTVDAPDLNGSRLTMMLERVIDSTVRGLLFETGPHAGEGAAEVERMAVYNEIPFGFVTSGGEREAWIRAIRDRLDVVLAAPRGA